MSGHTTTSRFLLWKDGTAQLQYEGGGYWATYTASQTELAFVWEGSNAANPWIATGTLVNDILTVRYNLAMRLDDFEDAVYKRVSS